MIVEHIVGVPNEHRIVVSMTMMEADLFLRQQPTLMRALREYVLGEVNGCEQRIRKDTR